MALLSSCLIQLVWRLSEFAFFVRLLRWAHFFILFKKGSITYFWYKVPDYYEEKNTDFKIDEHGQKWRRVGNICWYTNLDVKKRHEEFIFAKRYNEADYPKYDNYDAINVDLVDDIPDGYWNIMGVPATFVGRYNPEQFEILGFTNTGEENKGIRHEDAPHGRALLKGLEKFTRILIRRKK